MVLQVRKEEEDKGKGINKFLLIFFFIALLPLTCQTMACHRLMVLVIINFFPSNLIFLVNTYFQLSSFNFSTELSDSTSN